ncbi:hypothetical protein AAVH_34020, partial [Aphelenchoides avenae]
MKVWQPLRAYMYHMYSDGDLSRFKVAYFIFISAADASRSDELIAGGLNDFVERFGLKSFPFGLEAKYGKYNWPQCWKRFNNARQRRLELLDLIEDCKPAADRWEPYDEENTGGEENTGNAN